MAIVKTDAVILSTMPQGETSKILRAYTREYGKLSFIAKGSRKLNNRFGGSLDLLNHVSIGCYYKSNKDLHLVSYCDIIDSFPSVKADFEKLSIGLATAEVFATLVLEEEPNEKLFELLTGTLTMLEAAEKNIDNFYWHFLTRFLELSGFGLHLETCSKCGIEIKAQNAFFFAVGEGGLICSSCSLPDSVHQQMSADTIQVLKLLLHSEPRKFVNLRVSVRAKQELNRMFDDYFTYHFEGCAAPQAAKLMAT